MSSAIKCDRCLQIVEGGIAEVVGNRFEAFSYGGYLVVGTYWEKYANRDERFVCDECMWSNPRYIKDCGVVKFA